MFQQNLKTKQAKTQTNEKFLAYMNNFENGDL